MNRIRKAYFHIILMAPVFLALCQASALAQAPPNAGTLLQEQQRNRPVEQQRLNTETPEKEAPPLEDTGMKVVVRGFHFSGNEGLATDDELNELVKDGVGQELGLAGLKRFSDRVTKYLRDKGWFLARAYIPRQEIKGGVVEISIVPGKLQGGTLIRGKDLRISETRLEKMADSSVQTDQAANNKDLERAVLLMNDLPGVKANSTLEPGNTPGTTKLAVDASEGALVTGMVWGDNSGSRYTGLYRGNGLFQVNDPLGCGDQITFNTTNNTNYMYEQGGYSLPIGYSGLRAGFSYAEMRYAIDKEQIAADLDGGSRVAAATLSYPLIRSRTANLSTGVEYDWKNLWDRSFKLYTDDKLVNVGGAHLNGDLLDPLLGGGYSTFNLGVNAGSLDLSSDHANLVGDQLTAKSNGEYTKLTYAANRVQKIYDTLSLFLSVTGQVGFDNLDSSEKFILGGPNGVRAYPTGEAPGDSGGVVTAELRYDFPQIWVLGIPQLIGFYDMGWTQLHADPWSNSGTAFGNKNAYTLSGAGVGLNLVRSNVYMVHLAWAAKLEDNPGRSLAGYDVDGKNDSNRYWIQAMVMF